MINKIKETIDVQDAMDNIAAIASIDLKSPGPIGIVRGRRLITSEEELGSETAQWLSGEGVDPILDLMDLTYRSIHQHLARILEKGDPKGKEMAKALMDLVGESPSKLEAFFEIRLGHPLKQKVSGLEEFKSLQKFYQEHFHEEADLIAASDEAGLKDFQKVKSDYEYELFYIRNEEGKPYFDAELLRSIKLSCDFDLEESSFEEDPLLKVRAMQDRDLHASAGQILHECHSLFADFFHLLRKLEGNELSDSLSMAMIALYLAANPRNLLQNTVGKSCLDYFSDFHKFLRRAMKTSEYQKLIAYPDTVDKTSELLLQLTHILSRKFFERAGGVKLESIGLIHRQIRKGEEIKQKEKEKLYKSETIWNQLMLDDEKFRTLLSHFPNGPLFKILDLIRDSQEADAIIPFDPIGQNNLPNKVFCIERKEREIEVLRIPSPTRQSLIHKAEIIDEFKGFLRSLPKTKKLLFINLQDRTSWKEYARSKAIEALQFNAEFSQQIFVLSLPKNTDFYHQTNEYLNLNQASDFIKAFHEQISSYDQCGFFFPPQLKITEVSRFADLAIPLIHDHFFHGKNSLTRRNREDFIEIFYQLFILKCIDILEPGAIALSCKDGIDKTSGELAALYGSIKLLYSDLEKKEAQDFLRWLLYTPALFIRERAIHTERFSRVISMLERLEGELNERGKQIGKAFSDLYSFKSISIA